MVLLPEDPEQYLEPRQCTVHGCRFSDSIQLDVGEQCGCPPVPVDLQPNNDNATVMIPSTPSNQSVTAKVDDKEKEPLSTNTRRSCTLCENGDPPPFPDKLVEIGQEQHGRAPDGMPLQPNSRMGLLTAT